MGFRCIVVSAVCTALSFAGLKYWTETSLVRLKLDGLVVENLIAAGNVGVDMVSVSNATVALVVNFVFNAFILLVLSLKTIFFEELYPSETQKLFERFVNYIVYKGIFLPLVIPPTIYHTGLWSVWLIVVCSLKMFQALARDRLERLNASPSATPLTYFRVYSALLFVFTVDILWIRLCLMIYQTLGVSMFLLLLFEPFGIGFETLQTILVHGFQLLDLWLHHSECHDEKSERLKLFDTSATGLLLEWKGSLTRNLGCALDMANLLMGLAHYMHIWWLHGMAFHFLDVILFLNIRALLSAIIKRIKGFMKLRKALGALHAALPDATSDELRVYDDECAICREPMAKAKKLQCSHLFHLPCLRSWLDQDLNGAYSCPTCRKPLFVGRTESEAHPRNEETSNDEQLAHQISLGLNRQNSSGHTFPTGVIPNQTQNPAEGPWRTAGLDPSWLHTMPSQGVDGAGPSTAVGSVGLGRVQMMMRHFSSVGETYAQTAVEDGSWRLWPLNPSQASTAGQPIPPTDNGRYPVRTRNLHMRQPSRAVNDSIANILSMAETVREVLPHMPDDIIFQDLQRTNSATVTLNNLLQM